MSNMYYPVNNRCWPGMEWLCSHATEVLSVTESLLYFPIMKLAHLVNDLIIGLNVPGWLLNKMTILGAPDTTFKIKMVLHSCNWLLQGMEMRVWQVE